MPRPSILVIQHEDECPPAWFGHWLTQDGCRLDVRRPYAGEALPESLAGHRGLLVMGGHMSANDDARCDWLAATKALIREAQAESVPTFGICLGHQLITVALGGRVEPNPLGQQLGLIRIGWTGAADTVLGSRPARGIQWNNDIAVELPSGSTVLALTGRGEVQAVRFGPAMWGVQPHPEADSEVIRPWAEADRGRWPEGFVDRAVADIRFAEPMQAAAWRPVADAFADQVRDQAGKPGTGRTSHT